MPYWKVGRAVPRLSLTNDHADITLVVGLIALGGLAHAGAVIVASDNDLLRFISGGAVPLAGHLLAVAGHEDGLSLGNTDRPVEVGFGEADEIDGSLGREGSGPAVTDRGEEQGFALAGAFEALAFGSHIRPEQRIDIALHVLAEVVEAGLQPVVGSWNRL